MNSISSSLPSPLDARPSPPPSKDEVLVRVEGVSKKFCRSLKKSLWYGVCDIASELLPGRKHQRVAGSELLVASEEGRVAGNESRVTRSASGPATRHQSPATASETPSPPVTAPTGASAPVTSYRHPLPRRQAKLRFAPASSSPSRMSASNFAGGNAWGSLGIMGLCQLCWLWRGKSSEFRVKR